MAPEEQVPNPDRTLPEQRVGAALRHAREARDVSLRDMARRLNYNSHTTLVAYEHGDSMPTEQVVRGYEQVLRLEPGSLMEILKPHEWSATAMHGPSDELTCQHNSCPKTNQRLQLGKRPRVDLRGYVASERL